MLCRNFGIKFANQILSKFSNQILSKFSNQFCQNFRIKFCQNFEFQLIHKHYFNCKFWKPKCFGKFKPIISAKSEQEMSVHLIPSPLQVALTSLYFLQDEIPVAPIDIHMSRQRDRSLNYSQQNGGVHKKVGKCHTRQSISELI